MEVMCQIQWWGESKAFCRSKAWRYTISVENLAYKLECIVYLFHLIIENMHFYPLHTSKKSHFFFFCFFRFFGLVLLCSVARGSGGLIAPCTESQGTWPHTVLSFVVPISFSLPLAGRGSEGPTHSPCPKAEEQKQWREPFFALPTASTCQLSCWSMATPGKLQEARDGPSASFSWGRVLWVDHQVQTGCNGFSSASNC